MKKLAFSSLLFLLVIQSFGQPMTPVPQTEEDYLKMSRSQKTAGWILLGTSVGLLVGAGASYQIDFSFWGPPTEVDNTLSTVLAVASVGTLATSIACFSSAHKNRKKAASIALINQPILIPHQVSLASKQQPAVSLRIAF